MCNANVIIQHLQPPNNTKKFYKNVDDFIHLSVIDTSVLLVPQDCSYQNVNNNHFKFWNWELWILNTVNNGDYNEQNNTYTQCELIAEQFISYFERDVTASRNGGLASAPFHHFDRAEARTELIGPIGDNKFGVILKFRTGLVKNLCFNNSEWLTPTL